MVLDTRPLEEFNHISFPGGIAAPGAELLYRFFERCVTGHTGCRQLRGAYPSYYRRAGAAERRCPNPVASLENGTAAWLSAGLEPARGATTHANPPSAQGLTKAREASTRVAARFGVRTIDRALLDTFEAERGERTLYLFDIRTAEEFEAGHLPGAVYPYPAASLCKRRIAMSACGRHVSCCSTIPTWSAPRSPRPGSSNSDWMMSLSIPPPKRIVRNLGPWRSGSLAISTMANFSSQPTWQR